MTYKHLGWFTHSAICPLHRHPQNPVLRGVHRELVVPHLQWRREPVITGQLRALEQPPLKDRAALLDHHLTQQQPLMDGSQDLTPQCLRHYGHQVGLLPTPRPSISAHGAPCCE